MMERRYPAFAGRSRARVVQTSWLTERALLNAEFKQCWCQLVPSCGVVPVANC
jgi:hypothetical protein